MLTVLFKSNRWFPNIASLKHETGLYLLFQLSSTLRFQMRRYWNVYQRPHLPSRENHKNQADWISPINRLISAEEPVSNSSIETSATVGSSCFLTIDSARR
ncbi:hypothetical protein E1B28_002725 [Marasmius oreades]|uniref:Uncharacterized protein n=1 Tax=Marasmius oreades TaxID=181124 RepID=A0A9P7RNX6_9AGAR|nr:uncharacterized protein E1B28_002725 [Marasmius oreades]KAG7086797.1 hypothetical protein E1B28_002725 [Marasmius oreades]